MDTIYWPAVFWGFVVAWVLALFVAVILELRDYRKGERGDWWMADELLWAETDRWDPETLATKPGNSEETP